MHMWRRVGTGCHERAKANLEGGHTGLRARGIVRAFYIRHDSVMNATQGHCTSTHARKVWPMASPQLPKGREALKLNKSLFLKRDSIREIRRQG